MSLLAVLQFPNPKLSKVANAVAKVDEKIKLIAANMLETMYDQTGVGLAAIQVDIPLRIIVIDVSENRNQPMVLINPEIFTQSGSVISEEGCLSFRGVYDKVKRAEFVSVKYTDLDNKSQEIAADGLLSICLQHEIDHLNGITFYDHLTELKKMRIRKKIAKQSREIL